MRDRSIVLLSGGLDSVVNFALAAQETDIRLALFFDYGQESAGREWAAARAVAARSGVRAVKTSLPFLKKMKSGLAGASIPDFDPERFHDADYAAKTAQAVWVPNRNGLFLNIAAAFAESTGASLIVTGFNAEEGETFPDNTQEFLNRANRAFEYSTLSRPRAVSYTADMTKTRIVERGLSCGARLDLIWSCYHGRRRMCGRCESCRRLMRALSGNSYLDTFRKINRRGFA